MDPRNFFAELKRRNVYKVAAAYAVVAWFLIQAASTISPTFEAAAWTTKALIVAVAVGFPIALFLAWAFELTPEGFVRSDEVPARESIARRTGRKLDFLIIVVLIAVIALLVTDRFRRPSPTSAGSGNSIAVLPFENLSHDPDNDFFADGIQDDILTSLAKIADLKVIITFTVASIPASPEKPKRAATRKKPCDQIQTVARPTWLGPWPLPMRIPKEQNRKWRMILPGQRDSDVS